MQYHRVSKPAAKTLGSDAYALLNQALGAGHTALDEHGAKVVLRDIGIATPQSLRLDPERPAKGALGGLKPPFALKALSSDPIHKSDIGAIRLSLEDEHAVDLARREIAARMAEAGHPLIGFLVEEMVESGCELIIGGMHDPKLGPMIMVGAGGIFAEVLNDAAFGLCPISRIDAVEMVESLKITPILEGARGRPPADRGALIEALLALGGEDGFFWLQSGRIAEFDINPVIVRAKGMTAVDARFVLKVST